LGRIITSMTLAELGVEARVVPLLAAGWLAG
jgi:hypothetical protein